MELKDYRCTRTALYQHDCLGKNDISARQGYYIQAHGIEEAWEQMATRYPEETELGFTIQEWKGFDVKVVEIKRDKYGNIIE